MDTTTLDSNTITLMVTIAGSWLTLVGLIFFQFSRLDTKINALDTKFDTKIDALDTKIDTKIDALGRDVTDVRERLARVEGHLMGPGSLAPGPSPAPADGLDDDHRRAG
ncbi:MAG: hypothetical protein F4110_08540 [Acidimicrobiaceae bacterium]|nr:hypothetical protein [Acidimicrobiaceae bacterium]